MEKFDVFLCHNSKDKPAVIQVAEQLKQRKISPWLDIWHLRPGFSWQRALEQQIDQIGAVAVFVGGSGFGPWQSQEIDAFLREFVSRQCPVIPVLLPDAPQEPELPVFLQGLMWVDFRLQYPEPMGQLIWGIRGDRPGTTPIIQPHTRTDDLSSEKGINYTRLRNLLAAENWEEADEETYRVMIKAVDKKYGNDFTPHELLNFPCTDLGTIDSLWVKYSKKHFGFSVQKEIYLDVGGKADGNYDQGAWNRFGDRVGWRVQGKWIFDSNVNDTSSSRGHLPLQGWLRTSRLGQEGLGGIWNGFFDYGQIGGIWMRGGETRLRECSVLFSRIKTCKL